MKRVIANWGDWVLLTAWAKPRLKGKKPKPFVASIKSAPKTLEQLGYLHVEVLPKLTIALFDSGDIERKVERDAKYWLKREMGYGEWINYNRGKVFDADSFEKANIEVLTKAIDIAIHACEDRGIYVELPKKQKTKERRNAN